MAHYILIMPLDNRFSRLRINSVENNCVMLLWFAVRKHRAICALHGLLNFWLLSFSQLPFDHLRQVKTGNILFCGLISFNYYLLEVNPVIPSLWLLFHQQNCLNITNRHIRVLLVCCSWHFSLPKEGTLVGISV